MAERKTETTRTDFILDFDNLIVEVGGDWDRFAIENDAPELSGERIIGRSIFDFVSGNVTRQFFVALLQIVRAGRPEIELEYRCDSPELRRYMHMRVSCVEGGRVRFQNSVIRTEPRDRTVSIMTARHRTRDTHVRCSMCNQIKIAGNWVEPDHIDDVQLICSEDMAVIYGICKSCDEELQKLGA